MPDPLSLAIAATAVLVPRLFVPSADQAILAGEVETWTAPTSSGTADYLTLTPLGAARCAVTVYDPANAPDAACVPIWGPIDRDDPPIHRIETERQRRAARLKLASMPEPWRSVLNLDDARRELRMAVSVAKPMPERPKRVGKKHRARRRTRVGSTRKTP